MAFLPWSKRWCRNYTNRLISEYDSRLPDYNLEPPEDEEKKKPNGPDEPDNWEETCQILGLHS